MPVISFAETRSIYHPISRNIGRIPSRPLFPGVDVLSFKSAQPLHFHLGLIVFVISSFVSCLNILDVHVQTTNCPRELSFSRRKFNEFIVFTSSVPASFSRHIVTWFSRTTLLDSYCDVFLIVLLRHERADDLLKRVNGLSLIVDSNQFPLIIFRI